MTRSLIAALALAPLLAVAQPAAPASSAASAPRTYTKADITRNTPCGAPGIGEVWAGPRQGQIEPREGKPGYRVNENGYWAVGCKMPPKAKDCPETHVPPWRGKGGWHLCYPAKHAPLRARNVGEEWSTQTAPVTPGSRGEQRWRCERGADGLAHWVLVKSHCGM